MSTSTVNTPAMSKDRYELEMKLLSLKKRVSRAHQNKMIYAIRGNYPNLKRALNRRGWLQKQNFSKYPRVVNMPFMKLLERAEDNNTFEQVILSKLMTSITPHLVWTFKGARDIYNSNNLPMRNRVRRYPELDFTTKEGLARCTQLKQWYSVSGLSELTTPRSYMISIPEECEAFWKCFKTTACLSFIKYIKKNSDDVFDIEGTIDQKWIQFALDRVNAASNSSQNLDIDKYTTDDVNEHQWTQFWDVYKTIVNGSGYFECDSNTVVHLVNVSKMVENALAFWPETVADGFLNIWILKPGNRCRGLGISLLNEADKVTEFIKTHSNTRYIAQKYIERPLLIHNTKFDIRQYFLLSINNSFESIWMYKNCYLRFSGQEFSLNILKPSVHLTNYAVQKHFKVSTKRSELLPRHNMWSLKQFRDHLQANGMDELWLSKIYPTMRKNIIAVVMCAQEKTVFERNTFELYGCDFMITENYDTVLLEVNSNPDLAASTEVTRKICATVLEDVVKVIVDRNRSSSASTGDFEHIYDIPIPTTDLRPMKFGIEAKNYFQMVRDQKLAERAKEILQKVNRPKFKIPKEQNTPMAKKYEIKDIIDKSFKNIDVAYNINLPNKPEIVKTEEIRSTISSKEVLKKNNRPKLPNVKTPRISSSIVGVKETLTSDKVAKMSSANISEINISQEVPKAESSNTNNNKQLQTPRKSARKQTAAEKKKSKAKKKLSEHFHDSSTENVFGMKPSSSDLASARQHSEDSKKNRHRGSAWKGIMCTTARVQTTSVLGYRDSFSVGLKDESTDDESEKTGKQDNNLKMATKAISSLLRISENLGRSC